MTDSTSLPAWDDEDASFAGIGDKTLRVQVLLDADLFIFQRDLSAERGMSQSSLFRDLLIKERSRIAQDELSRAVNVSTTHGITQNLRNEDLNAIAELVAQKLDVQRLKAA